MDYTTSHVFPAGECTLQLRHGTVTRDIKYECAATRTLPPLRIKITQDSDWWSHRVFDAVDWTSHGRALQKHGQHRTTLVKLIHKILPLGKRVARYDKKYPPNCPSCRAPNKNLQHFWSCQAATRITWRRQFLKDLKMKLIKLETGPEVRHLLVSKLQAVLDGQSPNTIPVHPSLEEIGIQQDQIGWEQILRGRFGWVWNTHKRTQPGQSTKLKGHWTTEVITFIWVQWWKLWELRNHDQHGHDLATKQQAQARQ